MFKLAKAIVVGLIGFFGAFVAVTCHNIIKMTNNNIKNDMHK